MNLTAQLMVPDHVVSREVGGETVLLDLDSGTYFGLDEVGARVWSLLGQGLALSAVCDTIGREYDAQPETIETDVLELCGDLVDKRLAVLPS